MDDALNLDLLCNGTSSCDSATVNCPDYDEDVCSEYMKNENIEITVNLSIGSKNFTAYTMDLSKEYIEINSDYRS